ncbi:MAG: tRNA-intron lyase [archaeon]|nr:tRNA-intron lyase [archaeon]
MSKEQKITKNSTIISTIMEGIFQDNLVWVRFEDDTRKFFEKSYYGNLYNSDFEPILDSFEYVELDETSNSLEIQAGKNIPKNKRPAFIVLNGIEALYLIERQKLTLTDVDGNSLNFNDLIQKNMEVDPRIWQKYIVYRDIRHRGYIIRLGFGGNADFRVFARGAKFAKDSAKYVYFIIQDGIPVALNELEGVISQVLGDRKNLILAIFDKLGDSTFYQLESFKFNKIDNFEGIWNKESRCLIPKNDN